MAGTQIKDPTIWRPVSPCPPGTDCCHHNSKGLFLMEHKCSTKTKGNTLVCAFNGLLMMESLLQRKFHVLFNPPALFESCQDSTSIARPNTKKAYWIQKFKVHPILINETQLWTTSTSWPPAAPPLFFLSFTWCLQDSYRTWWPWFPLSLYLLQQSSMMQRVALMCVIASMHH